MKFFLLTTASLLFPSVYAGEGASSKGRATVEVDELGHVKNMNDESSLAGSSTKSSREQLAAKIAAENEKLLESLAMSKSNFKTLDVRR